MNDQIARVIRPNQNKKLLCFDELLSYKDLIYFLIKRDIKVQYKQSVLGFSWAVLRPLITMVVFTIIFNKFANIQSGDLPYPIFSYVALVPWTYFASTLSTSSASLISNSAIMSKIYFPRIIFPLTPIFSKFFDFLLSFSMLIVLMIYYDVFPSSEILFLPLLIVVMWVYTLGLSLLFSALSVQYRDVTHALSYLNQMLIYATPIIWPISYIPDDFRILYGLYPMGGLIEGFRVCLLGGKNMPWDMLIPGMLSSILIFLLGLYVFRKMESIFSDVI